jgi:hypothetical protein
MRITAPRKAWAGPARNFRGRPDDRMMDDPPSRIGSLQCRHRGVGDAAVDVNRRIAVGLRGLVADRRHRPLDIERSTVVAAHERIRHPVFVHLTPGEMLIDECKQVVLAHGQCSDSSLVCASSLRAAAATTVARKAPTSATDISESLQSSVTRSIACGGLPSPAIEQHIDRGKPLAVITLFGNLKQRAQAQIQVLSSFAPKIGNCLFRSATGISADPFLERHGSTLSLLHRLLPSLNLNITITPPKFHNLLVWPVPLQTRLGTVYAAWTGLLRLLLVRASQREKWGKSKNPIKKTSPFLSLSPARKQHPQHSHPPHAPAQATFSTIDPAPARFVEIEARFVESVAGNRAKTPHPSSENLLRMLRRFLRRLNNSTKLTWGASQQTQQTHQ